MTPRSNSSPARSKLSAALDMLMDVSTALGTLKEHDRLMEARLTSVEQRFDTLQHTILTLTHSAPKPCLTPTKPTPTFPNSTATLSPGQADTATATKSLLRRAAHKLGPEALLWGLGKLWAAAYPLLLPAIAFLGALLWKYLGPWWKFLNG